MKETVRFESNRKPRKCPSCNSARVAKILYGDPVISMQLLKDEVEGRIVLGGCGIRDDQPVWKCTECDTEIYKIM